MSMPRIVRPASILVASCVAALIGAVPEAYAQGPGGPDPGRIVPPGSKAYGKTYGDWQAERAAEETGPLLALPDPPTAIFAGNDTQALGVYRTLWQHSLRVPDDMSVVGFDDLPYAALVTPALTTVRQPLLEMGRVATTMLLRLVTGEQVDHIRVELATPLIVRESCAAL